MRVAVIGGHDRSELTLGAVARQAGHELQFHPGHVGGRGAGEIRAIVARADFVVIVTDVNSHGAVKVARDAARKHGHPVVFAKRFGMHQLERLFEERVAA